MVNTELNLNILKSKNERQTKKPNILKSKSQHQTKS